MSTEKKLSDEDQARVDTFLKQGVNSVERKPFRPFRLMLCLLLVVSGITVFSLYLASLFDIQ